MDTTDSPPLTALDRQILILAATPDITREARALILAAGALQAGSCSLETAIHLLQDPQLSGFNLPTPLGVAIGQELARLTGDCPGCCPTCAFRLGTVPNQSKTSVEDALDCVITNTPFHCHHDDHLTMTTPDPPIQISPEALKAIRRALREGAERWNYTDVWHEMDENDSAWFADIYTDVTNCFLAAKALALLDGTPILGGSKFKDLDPSGE